MKCSLQCPEEGKQREVPGSLLGTDDRIHKNGTKLFRLDSRKHLFTMMVVKQWHRLPREVIDALWLLVFKIMPLLISFNILLTLKRLGSRT